MAPQHKVPRTRPRRDPVSPYVERHCVRDSQTAARPQIRPHAEVRCLRSSRGVRDERALFVGSPESGCMTGGGVAADSKVRESSDSNYGQDAIAQRDGLLAALRPLALWPWWSVDGRGSF